MVAGKTDDSICLPVSISGIPASIEMEGYMLQLKTKFHATLVAAGEMLRKGKAAEPDFLRKVVADFCEFVKENPIELIRYRDEYRFMAEDEKRSVVVMVDVSNLDKFFALLNKKYNLQLEYPPTHVTLYTLQPDVGIFMTDQDDLQRLTKLIQSPVKL